MAKKAYSPDPKAITIQRIMRTEAYAEKVRILFAATVNEILALNKSVPRLDEGVMYSFDGDSQRMQKKVEALLRQLHSVVTMAIRKGIALEWEQANIECDKLVSSCFGKEILSSPEFSAWTNRNTAAMNAFANRSDDGLNLSQKVWKSVRQFRDQMEVAMTVAIGEGDSAQSMSRKVRQYLNDPDLMFRRFRFKKGEDAQGNPIYGLKWKKRIKDEKTGKYRWIDYDKSSYHDEWTGKGYYKSSAQNAMRVTRTETNIAYRRSDHERWKQMEFVLGQRIQLSKNHPKKDICDKLAGDYPPDFVFDGWHVQCFCFATPILMDEEEMAKVTAAFLKGEKYTPQGKKITEYPDNFKSWVQDNKENILASRDKGTEPYFIRNNARAIDEILNPQPKELTIAEKAAIRHEARTPEQADAIRNAWAERQKKHQQIKTAANNIVKVAGDYGEVDYSTLQKYIDAGDLSAMQAETKKVAQTILATKKAEQSLSSIIPNVHSWHKQFKMEQLQGVYDAVKSKIESWAGLSLEQQAKKLHFEAYDFLGGNMKGVQEKYPTWKVSQEAYIKELNAVNYKISLKQAMADVALVEQWAEAHPKSLNVAKLLSDAKQAIANDEDIATIKQKVSLAVAEKQKREMEQARRDAKKVLKSLTLPNISKAEINRLLDQYESEDFKDADTRLRSMTGSIWKSLTKEERIILTKYTQTYSYLNEPLRGQTYYGARGSNEFEHDLPILTRALEKFSMPQNTVVRRGVGSFEINELGYSLGDLKVGDVFVEKGFLSTAIHRSGGFSDTYNLVIVVPKGAKGVYAEPFSHYTDYNKFEYDGMIWDGESVESVRSEMEWIGQRGSQFRVLKKQGRTIYLQMIGQLK